MLDRDPLGANYADFNPDEYQSYLSKKQDVDWEPDFETTGLDMSAEPQVYRGPEDTDFYTRPAQEWRNFDYQPEVPANTYPAPDAAAGAARNLIEELNQLNWPQMEDEF